MSIETIIQRMEDIKSDPKISAEEKKKQLKRLRRQLRKQPGYVSKRSGGLSSEVKRSVTTTYPGLTPAEILSECTSKAIALGLDVADPKETTLYGYLMNEAALKGANAEVIFEKFRKRWKFEPRCFAVVYQGKIPIFALGPLDPGDPSLDSHQRWGKVRG